MEFSKTYSFDEIKNNYSSANKYKGINSFGNNKNEAIIWINNYELMNKNKNKISYPNEVTLNKINYYASKTNTESSQKEDKRNGNHVLYQALKLGINFCLHVFVRLPKDKNFFLGDYFCKEMDIDELNNNKIYILNPFFISKIDNEFINYEFTEKKENNREELININKNNLVEKKQFELLKNIKEIDKKENKNYSNQNNYETSEKTQKIQDATILHNNSILDFVNNLDKNDFIIFTGKHSDLVTIEKSTDILTIYEFKTINNSNFESQTLKAIGQLYYYQYLIENSYNEKFINKKIKKCIVYVPYEKVINKTIKDFIKNKNDIFHIWM